MTESRLQIVIEAMDKASGVINNVSRSFENAGKKIEGMGRSLTTKLTLPLAGVGAGMFKFGMDFSKALGQTNTMLKVSQSQLQQFGKGILDISNKTGIGAADLAKAAYNITSVLHTNASQTLDILKGVSKAAEAGGITAQEAVGSVIKTLNNYKISAKDTMKVVDSLSATVNAGDANWQQLASVFPNLAEKGAGLGIKLKNLEATFAALSGKSGNAFEAGTQLTGVLIGLTKTTPALKKALKDMGYDSGQAAIKALGLSGVMKKLNEKYGKNSEMLSKLFPNIRALSGFMGLFADNGKALGKSLDIVSHSSGETQKQINASMNTYKKFSIAINELRNNLIRLFILVSPYLLKFVGYLTNLMHKFEGLSPSTKKWILIIGGVTMVLGPVLVVLGNLITIMGAVGKAASFLMANPIILAIGLVIAAMVLWIVKWKEIKKGLKVIWTFISSDFKILKSNIEYYWLKLWKAIKKEYKKIKTGWDNFWGGVKKTIFSVWDSIESKVMSVWNTIKKPYEMAKGAVGSATNWVGNEFHRIIGGRQFGGYIPETGIYYLHRGETVSHGQGITIHITGNTFLGGEEVAEQIGDLIIDKLRMSRAI